MTSRGDRFASLVDRGLPALCLVIVAALQITLAHRAGLSPWKGGGFGMFAAIDSPGMRVLTVVGIDSAGVEHRISTSEGMNSKRTLTLRSYPDAVALRELAGELLDSEFVSVGSRMALAFEQIRVGSAGEPLDLPFELGQRDWYRARRPDDPHMLADQVRRFETIRVQVWRLRFDAARLRVWMEPLLSPIEVRRPS